MPDTTPSTRRFHRSTRRPRPIALALALLGALSGSMPSGAQEIIVARRMTHDTDCAPTVRPAAMLRKRADNVVQQLLISDDSRDADVRMTELKQAIASLAEAARQSGGSHGVEIALIVETQDGVQLVRAFESGKAIAAIQYGSRADTAQVRLLAKTPIGAADQDLSQPVARIEGFIRKIKLAGRAQIETLAAPALSIVDPQRYRGEVAATIAADVRLITSQLGGDYAGKLEGLEHPLEWVQLDELELGLFIPYRLTIGR